MSRAQSSGELRIDFIPGETGITNIHAPTVTELATGQNLSAFRLHDGLSTPRGANMVDASDAGSLDTKQSVGTRDVGPLVVTCHRDKVKTDDDAWTALTEEAYGHIVVRRFGGSSAAYASLQDVEVYPVQVASKAMADTAINQTQRFTATFAVTKNTALEAVVAA
jgi:hypothetical protein